MSLKKKHDKSWNENHEYLAQLIEGKNWLEKQWKAAVMEKERLELQQGNPQEENSEFKQIPGANILRKVIKKVIKLKG